MKKNGLNSHPITRVGIIGLLIAMSLSAVCVVIHTIISVATHFYPSIYWDQWDLYNSFFAYGRNDEFWKWLFLPHNGHRFVLCRLLGMLDFAAFGGSNHFVIGLIFLNQACLLLLFGRMILKSDACGLIKWIGVAAIGILTFSSSQIENLGWSNQIQFVNVFLFSFLALMFARLSVENRSLLAMFATIIAAVFATFSMANGLLVWFVIGAYFLLNRKWFWGVLHIVAFVLMWKFYFPEGNEDSLTLSAVFVELKSIGLFLSFLLVYLGNPLGHEGYGLAIAYAVVSLLCLLMMLGLKARLYVTQSDNNKRGDDTLLFAGFIVLTAVATSLGRSEFGVIGAIAGRYAIGGLLFVATLCVSAFVLWKDIAKSRWMVVVLSVWGFATLLYLASTVSNQMMLAGRYETKHDNKMIALNAIRNGALDLDYLKYLHPNLRGHGESIKHLKEREESAKVHNFQTPEVPIIEDVLDEQQIHAFESRVCLGFNGLDSTQIVFGKLAVAKEYNGASLYFRDAQGNWVGSGFVVSSIEASVDRGSVTDISDGELYFYGHNHSIQSATSVDLFLEVEATLQCVGSIEFSAVPVLKTLPLLHIDTAYEGKASYQVLGMDPGWSVDGVYPTGIARIGVAEELWGSWTGADTHTGQIQIEIQVPDAAESILFPYLSGPVDANAELQIEYLDGVEGAVEYRIGPNPYWVYLEVDLPDGVTRFKCTVDEMGFSWGQWIGIANPYWK